MATKKIAPVLEGIDLAAFVKQKQLVETKASEAIAERVQTIRAALGDMKAIVQATGVSVNIQDLLYEFESSREELDPNTDWNSSSAYC